MTAHSMPASRAPILRGSSRAALTSPPLPCLALPRSSFVSLAAGLALLAGHSEARAQIEFVSVPPQQAEVGTPYTYTMRATVDDDDDDDDDDDGDGGPPLRFAIEAAPGWLEFDDIDTLFGTPGPADTGSHPVRVRASLGRRTATQSFTIDVAPSNASPPDEPPPDDSPPDDPADDPPPDDSPPDDPTDEPPPDDSPPDDPTDEPPPDDSPPADPNSAPVFNGMPTVDAAAGDAIDVDIGRAFSDPDGDSLTLTAIGLPGWLVLDASRLVGIVPADAGGASIRIRIVAADGDGASAQGELRIDVRPGDEPPVLPNPPPILSTREDTPLEITPALLGVVDDGASPLTVRLTPPADASFSLDRGGTTVVPAADFHGTLTVEARVRDAHSTSNAVVVTIVVEPVNDAPRIAAIPPQTVTEGSPFALNVGEFVSDPEDDPLSFAAENLPSGWSIDSGTGRIGGTAPRAARGDRTIRIVVDDGAASTDATFRLRVLAADRADLAVEAAVAPNPVRVGEPATFSFTVTNLSDVEVPTASLSARFSADAPFVIDEAGTRDCDVAGEGADISLSCAISPLGAGSSRSIEAIARAEAPAEIGASVTVAIAEPPIDDMPDNDAAAVTLIVGREFGSGASQQLVAPGARAAATGDLDGDGFTDLVVSSGDRAPLLLFRNEVDPDATPKRILAADPVPIGEPHDAADVATGDLDGDGRIDIVAAAARGAHRVLFNDGTGGFAEQTVAAGGETRAVALADLDGDGLPELLFAGVGTANLVYRNAGGRRFEPLEPPPIDAAVDIVAADLAGDAVAELVVAAESGELLVLARRNGGFEATAAVGIGGAASVDAADFDGDGRIDLVVGRQAAGADAIYLNTSSSSPSFFLVEELGASPTARVLAADFDLDGRADVVSVDAAGGHRLYKNGGAASGAFLLHETQFVSPGALGATSDDFNGDGRADVAVVTADAVFVFLNDGRGNLGRGDVTAPVLELVGEPAVTLIVGDEYVEAGAIAVDDVDGDLTEQIVVGNEVDADVIGTYAVTYDVTDSSGNRAPTLMRSVEVRARDAGGGGGGGAAGAALLLALAAALARRAAEAEPPVSSDDSPPAGPIRIRRREDTHRCNP